MSRIIHTYKKFLSSHPFLVQTVQTGMLMGVGDVIAQRIVEKKTHKEHDYKRTMTFLGLGTCLVVSLHLY